MSRAAAKTGSGPMVTVAIEQHFPRDQRIIDYDLAYQILPFGMRTFVWLMRPEAARDWMVRASEKAIPGIWGGMMCRKRYIAPTGRELASTPIERMVHAEKR
ncbi:MAG: hypothetical protein JSW54_08915 [Fidelibacterota bacterium]|nr:MAG: hypothetical protein JSW54_08915 [Candidatus Neomarinimicrobiota bacterium]